MRSRGAAGRVVLAALGGCALLAAIAAAGPDGGYRLALPGYRYEFPRDHFDHPAFQTEWWYYTGNLRTRGGRALGFELTFFRQAVNGVNAVNGSASPWDVHDVYLAHFAVSDLDGGRFLHDQRMNRAGPGLAGASLGERRVWNGNWQARWEGEAQRLQAIAAGFSIELTVRPMKPPVVHGVDGVSQKAEGPGRASHYVSFTRLATSGSIEIEGERHEVEGLSWMDHEFFTSQLSPGQAGWDWFSLQLDDDTELMLYRLRRADGTADPYSAGTFVDAAGRTRHLRASDFRLQPRGRTWASRDTKAVYPLEWSIEVAPLGLSLLLRTPLDSQEIASRHAAVPSYWEGAIRVSGTRAGTPVAGSGYLEMTGYDRREPLSPSSHRPAERQPAGDEQDAADRRDRPQPADAGDGQQVQGAAEEENPEREEQARPPGPQGRREVRPREQRRDQDAQRVHEVIEDRLLPDSERVGVEAVPQPVRAEGAEADGEGEREGGDGRPSHGAILSHASPGGSAPLSTAPLSTSGLPDSRGSRPAPGRRGNAAAGARAWSPDYDGRPPRPGRPRDSPWRGREESIRV